MSFEPTEEMAAAYCYVRSNGFYPDLADLAQHAMAAALEAEFWSQHSPWKPACGDIQTGEFGNRTTECSNPGHNYRHADWLRLADEKLRK